MLKNLRRLIEDENAEANHLDPKITPLDGALARLAIVQTEYAPTDLLDILDGEDEVSSKQAFEAMQHNSTHWKPSSGNIKILSREIAESILTQTQTEFIPEPEQNRVRLIHGDFNTAHRKLQNLDPLMSLKYEQRGHNTLSKSTSSVLVTVDEASRPLHDFQHVNFFEWPGFPRIIVAQHQHHLLDDKYVCEARIKVDGQETFHPNLRLDPDVAVGVGGFSLWAGSRIKEMGDVKNRKSARRTTLRDVVTQSSREAPQRYLNPVKAADVKGWADTIVNNIDPNTVAPVAPEEPEEGESGRRPQVAVDSDHEAEEDSDMYGPGRPPRTQTPPPEESRRKRAVAVDSDDSDDDEDMLGSRVTTSEVSAADTALPQGRDSDRLLSEIATQFVTTGDAFGRAPPSDLLGEEKKDAFDFDRGIPSNLARHFEVQNTKISHSLSIPPTASVRSRGVSQRGSRSRGGGRVAHGSITGRSESSNEFRQQIPPPTLSEVSWSRLPPGQNATPAAPIPDLLDNFSQLPRSNPDSGYSTISYGNRQLYHQMKPQPDPNVDPNSKSWERRGAYNGRKLQGVRQDSLAQLEQLANGIDSAKSTTESGWSTIASKFAKGKKTRGTRGREQRAGRSDDIRYHSTMSQKAANPTKKKSKGKPAMSKAQKLKALLDDAYGAAPVAQAAQSGARAQNNTSITGLKFDDPQFAYREVESEALKTRLSEIFEASRAFSGKVEFAMHFGQALLSANPRESTKSFDTKAWNRVFGINSHFVPPSALVSNILTTNGAEMDRVLEIKSPLPKLRTKMFDRDRPGRASVSYEFFCRTKSGETFTLVVNPADPKLYEIRHPLEMIGSVCLQCPARVWDACATVEGTSSWKHDADVEANIRDFVSSIYVAPGERLCMNFRQPTGNVLSILHQQMKRTSLHQCLIPGLEDFQMRITEVQALQTSCLTDDRKCWKAQEYDHSKMLSDSKIHYEACLVDSSMNDALMANKDLEVGELTDATTTGKSLLESSKVQHLVELTVAVLNKIDFVGFQNQGTLLRKQCSDEETRLVSHRGGQLPVMHASHIYGNSANPLSASSGLRMAPSENGRSEMLKAVHGTRMNTRAEIRYGEDGQAYQVGIGGARVPVTLPPQLGSIQEDNIMPDDSASQYGAPKQGHGAGKGQQGSAQSWKPRTTVEEKPYGYW